jgi:DNA-3-methyladenine glycosylase II
MNPQALKRADMPRIAQLLARRDKDLAQILRTHGPPPLWSRPAGFPTLIKIILEQQVSLASAASIFNRLKQAIVPFTPALFIEFGEMRLRQLGLTRQKAAYCVHLAECIVQNRLPLKRLSRFADHEVQAALMQVKGLGAWSADVYLLMVLRRPDIFPATDLALIGAVTELKQLKTKISPSALVAMAEAWRPYRSVAARMLWQYYLASRGKL